MRAGVTDVLGVLAFSALPFATVQALADSDFGKKLRVSTLINDSIVIKFFECSMG